MTKPGLTPVFEAFRRLRKDAASEAHLLDNEHLRHRDGDLSAKAGATLGYGALVFAAALVLLSAGRDSVLHVEQGAFAAVLALGASVTSLMACFCALISILKRGKFLSTVVTELLDEYDQVLEDRQKWVSGAFWACLVATVMAILAAITAFFW